tara:strand:- start:46 stop:225 length:180 start_codon:yes stop_codon:yes gene_type:complete
MSRLDSTVLADEAKVSRADREACEKVKREYELVKECHESASRAIYARLGIGAESSAASS